jgi:hypothetical protein
MLGEQRERPEAQESEPEKPRSPEMLMRHDVPLDCVA